MLSNVNSWCMSVRPAHRICGVIIGLGYPIDSAGVAGYPLGDGNHRREGGTKLPHYPVIEAQGVRMQASPHGYRMLLPFRLIWPYWQGSSVPLFIHLRPQRDGIRGTYQISVAGRGVGGDSLPTMKKGHAKLRVEWPKGVALENRGNHFTVSLATTENGKETAGDHVLFTFQAPETEQALLAFLAFVATPGITLLVTWLTGHLKLGG